MNRYCIPLLLLALSAAPVSPTPTTQPDLRPSADDSELANYKLAWHDEFNDSRLDTSAWVFRTDSKMWSTQLPENVSVSDGLLRLAVKKQSAGNKAYTGAGVITKQSFKYGYYEARFKVPPGAGWHTSFWMQFHNGSGGTSPSAATQELDVCENDSVNLHSYGVNVHQWNPQPHKSFGHKAVQTPDLSADFHTFGCIFTPSVVKYYFDGKVVQTVDATQFPHGEQHIWLTTIASNLGNTKAVDDAKLPAEATYDYVRFFSPAVP
jgi:beta-glucanase (GH16 family)